ncbi:hypothetical protein BH09BAC4_BH09BAC4_06350 [soil metagenome]
MQLHVRDWTSQGGGFVENVLIYDSRPKFKLHTYTARPDLYQLVIHSLKLVNDMLIPISTDTDRLTTSPGSLRGLPPSSEGRPCTAPDGG